MIFVLLIHTVLALSVAFSGTDSLWARLRWLEIHTLLLASGWGLTVIPSIPCLSSLPGGINPGAKGGKSLGKVAPACLLSLLASLTVMQMVLMFAAKQTPAREELGGDH